MTTRNHQNPPQGTLDRLRRAGWVLDRQIVAPYSYTSGRILRHAKLDRHDAPRTAEVLLRLSRDLPLSIVESADDTRSLHDALDRATEHAEWLGLPYAHALDHDTILERHVRSGELRELARLPAPEDLWRRTLETRGVAPIVESCLRTPSHHDVHRPLRYHQIRAVNAAVESVARGDRDVRLVLGAGTGRTYVAFLICHRLWSAHWNARAEARRPRILYVCDGDDLLDAARTGVFAPFRGARHALSDGVIQDREMYFATPDTIVRAAGDARVRDALEPSFFDLIVEDRIAPEPESEDAGLAEALRRFESAVRLRLGSFTPVAGSVCDSYSLRRGVEDGFLAPYDLVEIDRETDKRLAGRKGTKKSAAALAAYLEATDPFAKTLVSCADDDHAARMTECLVERCSARVAQHRDYVVCLTPDEAGRVRLDRFRDVDRRTPVVGVATKTTSMRSVPTLANVALCAPIESEAELVAQVGQGVYLMSQLGKWHYDVLDLTGDARDALARSTFVAQPDRVTRWSASKGGAA